MAKCAMAKQTLINWASMNATNNLVLILSSFSGSSFSFLGVEGDLSNKKGCSSCNKKGYSSRPTAAKPWEARSTEGRDHKVS